MEKSAEEVKSEAEKAEEEKKKAEALSKTAQKVSEEDLIKKMKELEGKKEEEKPTEVVPPEVAPIVLAKSVDELKGNEGLQKALDVSEPLSQMAEALTKTMDAALEQMQKSANNQNDFNLSLLTTMENLAKSIDEMQKKVEEYGSAPMRPRSTTPGTGNSGRDLLLKHAGGEEGKTEAPREEVLRGLVSLAKSAEEPEDMAKWAKVTSIFETTSQIDDGDLKKAMAAANGAG